MLETQPRHSYHSYFPSTYYFLFSYSFLFLFSLISWKINKILKEIYPGSKCFGVRSPSRYLLLHIPWNRNYLLEFLIEFAFYVLNLCNYTNFLFYGHFTIYLFSQIYFESFNWTEEKKTVLTPWPQAIRTSTQSTAGLKVPWTPQLETALEKEQEAQSN